MARIRVRQEQPRTGGGTARATLDHVEWHLGDVTLTCTLDDMLAWDEDLHHPADDRPPCSHTFTTLDDWQLTTHAVYTIEQQLTRRLTRTGTYLTTPWEPHPTRPTVTVSNDIGTMRTLPIYAVNTAPDYESGNEP